jgi:hypothetical protein
VARLHYVVDVCWMAICDYHRASVSDCDTHVALVSCSVVVVLPNVVTLAIMLVVEALNCCALNVTYLLANIVVQLHQSHQMVAIRPLQLPLQMSCSRLLSYYRNSGMRTRIL